MQERARAKELLEKLGMSKRRQQIYGEGIDRATPEALASASAGLEDALNNSVDAGLAIADRILARRRARLALEPPGQNELVRLPSYVDVAEVPTHEARTPRSAGSFARVLVIDDSPTVRQQVGLTLSRAGYQVIDGVDAIGKVDPSSIAMLICDLNMPDMNGLEMLEKLREDARWKALPVVMLTTEGQPGLIDRAKRAGAQDWIIKPVEAELLLAVVRRFTA